MSESHTDDPPIIPLEVALATQARGVPNGWCCPACQNYAGGLRCAKGIFIAFEGANMTNCADYAPGKKCIHCGRIT